MSRRVVRCVRDVVRCIMWQGRTMRFGVTRVRREGKTARGRRIASCKVGGDWKVYRGGMKRMAYLISRRRLDIHHIIPVSIRGYIWRGCGYAIMIRFGRAAASESGSCVGARSACGFPG